MLNLKKLNDHRGQLSALLYAEKLGYVPGAMVSDRSNGRGIIVDSISIESNGEYPVYCLVKFENKKKPKWVYSHLIDVIKKPGV